MSYFDLLERDLVAAARPPRKRRWAAFGLTAAVVIGVAGTAAGGTYVALRASGIAPFADSAVTPEQRVAPGTSVVPEIRATDPEAGVPPWTVRVSRSATGLVCSTVGQVRGSEFGLVGLDGVFRSIPEANADACGEPGSLFGTRVFAARRSRDVRTVVNGVAGEDVTKVTLALAGQGSRALPVSPEGAFAYVIRGYPEDVAPVITVERRGGAVRRYTFGSGFVVPDPLGGAAWTTRGVGGRYNPGKRTRVGCVRFETAREGKLKSPAVCGIEPNVGGTGLMPMYFRTGAVHGRVAIWGSIRGRGDVVVRAGGFSETIDKTRAAFVVFLPQGTDPSTVTVTARGKHYGSTYGTVPAPKGIR